MNILFFYLIGALIAYFYLLNRYLVMKEALTLIQETDPSSLTYDRFVKWTKEHKPTLYFIHEVCGGEKVFLFTGVLVWFIVLPMMFFYWLSKPLKKVIKPHKIRETAREIVVGVTPYKVVDAFKRGRDYPWLEDVPLFDKRKK